MYQARRMLEHVRLDTERIEEEKREVMRAVEGKTISQVPSTRTRQHPQMKMHPFMDLTRDAVLQAAGLQGAINRCMPPFMGLTREFVLQAAELQGLVGERDKVRAEVAELMRWGPPK